MTREKQPYQGITIEQIDPRKNLYALRQLAQIYADAFAGPPWNEYTRCTTEVVTFFGRGNMPGTLCPNGDGKLVLAYPLEDTMKYISKEMDRPNSTMFIGKDHGKIIGFSWGYTYNEPKEFALDKYTTPEMQEKVTALLKANGLEQFYYFSETGISDEYRGHGIANQFYDVRMKNAKALGFPIIVRTNCESPMMAVATRSNFTQIMGPAMIVDGARRIIQPTNRIINFQDTEIERRVLFCYNPK